MCLAAHMNSRGRPPQSHKCGIKAANAPPEFMGAPAREGRWLGNSKPMRDVIGEGAEDAESKGTPQNAQQQHGIRALDKVPVGQMSEGASENSHRSYSLLLILRALLPVDASS